MPTSFNGGVPGLNTPIHAGQPVLNIFTQPKPTPDKAAILVALAVLFEPDQVIELRAIHTKGRKRTDAGYFDSAHWPVLADHAVRLSNSGAAVYITMNPVHRQLLGRFNNRIEEFATATTTDQQIIKRRWLLIDLDPVKPSHTSSTDIQLEAAHLKAQSIYAHLKTIGWADPVVGLSGNGYHLLYAIDLVNDKESTSLLKAVLSTLAEQFDDDQTKVDRSVFNAGRICKFYGTIANKGDHTAAAPWRQSKLEFTPSRVLVTEDQLRKLSTVAPQPRAPTTRMPTAQGFNLEDFFARHGVTYTVDIHAGSERFKLDTCPFNSEHINGEAAIFRETTGRLGFKCQHDSCGDKKWKDVRELLDGSPQVQARISSNFYKAKELAIGDTSYMGGTDSNTLPDFTRFVILTNGADLVPEAITWIWRYWLACGKLHLLAGTPGQGKTTIAMAMAAIVTQGGYWPDGSKCEAGNVLIWSGEDDPADTLLPRLIASGADPSKCFFISGTRCNGEVLPFDPTRDMAGLDAQINSIGAVKLLIVDPIVSAIAGDSHKNAEVRRNLQPLVDLAAKSGLAIIGITHLSKGGAGADPASRIIGSIAFTAVARVVMVAAKVLCENGEHKRILARAKSNIGPDDGGFEYQIDQSEPLPGIHASHISWGDALTGTARELLTDADSQDKGDTSTDQDDAMELLKCELVSDCWTDSKLASKPLAAAGFTKKQIWNATKKLDVIRHQSGFGTNRMVHWRLPGNKDVPFLVNGISL